jgi:branched-chain amino acid transport system substrate-binding protein
MEVAMVTRGFVLSLFAAAVCALGLSACNKSGSKDEKGEIVIAVSGPMTGSAAAFGKQIRNAAELKVKEVNDAGGINGRKIRLQIEDDKGDTTEATTVARKLASDKEVCVLVGHFNSTCTIAAKDEYNRKGLASLSPGSTNVTVCAGSPWTFRNLYRDDYQGRFTAHYAKKKLKIEKWAIFYDNDDYGKGLMRAFKAEAEKIGVQIVATESYIRERTQDFKPLLQKAKSAGPGGIFVAGLYNEAALICKSARIDLGMDVVFLGSDGVMSSKFIEIAGDAAEGAYVASPFLFNTGADTPESKAFYEAYRKAYDMDPDTWSALTYDAMGMVIKAIETVGTDRTKIRDWLAACTSEEKGYKGVTGITFFDKEGDCFSKPVQVTRITKGKFGKAPQMTVAEMKKND